MHEDPPWLLELRTETLRRLEKHQVSRSQLARHLGVSRSLVSQVLSGDVKGTPELLDRMATAVGLRIRVISARSAPALRKNGN